MTKPPSSRLVRSRGIALQALLTILFEAQCRTRPGQKVSANLRPLSRQAGQLAWFDLLGACTGVTTGVAVTGSTAKDKQMRQIRRALALLASPGINLVKLDDTGGPRGRYERFSLLHEGGRTRAGQPQPYTVPQLRPADGAAEETFALDARFFINGWVHALEETEIVFLCMVADLQMRKSEEWVGISEHDRRTLYGIGDDAYRAHQLLSLCGLIEVDIPVGRRSDGTFEAYEDPGWGGSGAPPHRFRLNDDGFGRQALPTLIAGITKLSQSVSAPASTQRRPAHYRSPRWSDYHYGERRGLYHRGT